MKNRYFYMSLLCLVSFLMEAQKFHVDTIVWSGITDNRVNLVVLGDGYTIDELDKFDQDAIDLSEYFLEQIPINSYNNFFNVISIRVPSNETGAALDPSMPIDNYYGSSYNVADIDRLLVPLKSGKIRNVLIDNFPTYDIVVMVVNHNKYGGSGGGLVATTSTNSRAPEIVVHELGHSFGHLRDEYWAGARFARESINMTQETDPDSVIWKRWHGENGIGIYPFSEDTTWHRPHTNCKMRRLGVPFCSVCTEAMVENIHVLVNTIDSWLPIDLELNLKQKDSIPFEIELVYPDPNTLDIEWRFEDSTLTKGVTAMSIFRNDIPEGENELEVIIKDTTSYSRRDVEIHRLNWVKWQIIKDISTSITSTQHSVNYKFWPNPVDDQLHIQADMEGTGRIISMEGKVIQRFKVKKGRTAIDWPITISTTILIMNFDGRIVRHTILKPR